MNECQHTANTSVPECEQRAATVCRAMDPMSEYLNEENIRQPRHDGAAAKTPFLRFGPEKCTDAGQPLRWLPAAPLDMQHVRQQRQQGNSGVLRQSQSAHRGGNAPLLNRSHEGQGVGSGQRPARLLLPPIVRRMAQTFGRQLFEETREIREPQIFYGPGLRRLMTSAI